MKRPSYQLKLSRNGAKFPDFQQNNSAEIEKKNRAGIRVETELDFSGNYRTEIESKRGHFAAKTRPESKQNSNTQKIRN